MSSAAKIVRYLGKTGSWGCWRSFEKLTSSRQRPGVRRLDAAVERTARRRSALLFKGAVLACSFAAAQVHGVAAEPRNLDSLKRELRAYHDSGEYERTIARVAEQAKEWIEQRSERRKPGERLAIVVDFDETLASNWPEFRANGFGYIEEKWLAWVETGSAPPIAPMVDLVRMVQQRGIDVFVLTSRPESQRAATAKNLAGLGCAKGMTLICAPNDCRETAAKFKTAERQKLAEAGYVIIANVGDQESDLTGGNAERTFKLPNPFYHTD